MTNISLGSLLEAQKSPAPVGVGQQRMFIRHRDFGFSQQTTEERHPFLRHHNAGLNCGGWETPNQWETFSSRRLAAQKTVSVWQAAT